jgi:hypothetical protein
VPNLLRLLDQSGDEVWMRMAERIDGDPGGKIEVAIAVCRGEPNAFAPLKSEIYARESRHQM